MELFTKGEYILCLRLASELVDLRQGYANSFTHSVNEVKSSTASAKKKKTTARVVFVELFTKGEYILCLRLASELVDLRQGYANSFTHSVNEVKSSTASAKKKKTTARVVFFFLVEVWRFELQASSTRTNTASFFDYFC